MRNVRLEYEDIKIDAHKTQVGFYRFLKGASVFCTVLAVAAMLAVVLYVLISGITHIDSQLLFGKFVTEPSILPAFVGTVEIVLIAMAVALPIGMGSAIFLAEYTNSKSRLVKAIRVTTETLAGIPSIVYGLFGYLVFVVFLKWKYTILGGGLTISLMILPVIVRSVEEALLSVPEGYREGSYALGASKVRTIFKVVIPAAGGGIVTAVILAVGRVVSESAVLLLTIGMAVRDVPSSLMQPGTTLALDIYYFANLGYEEEAAATAVVLLIMVIALNLLATGLGKLLKRRYGETK